MERILGISVEEYNEKIQKIYDDTCFMSNLNYTIEHEDFKYLLSFGERIVPWIINDLKSEKQDWTHILLLAHIIKDDAYIKEKSQDPNLPGRFNNHIEMWLGWWEQRQREKKFKRIIDKDTE